MPFLSSWFVVVFKPSVPLLMFRLLILSIFESSIEISNNICSFCVFFPVIY